MSGHPSVATFKPNEFQDALVKSWLTRKITIAETAVRTGKSVAGAVGHYHLARSNPGVNGAFGVPSYAWYMRIGHDVYREVLGKVATYHGTNHTWTFKRTGNKVTIISGESQEQIKLAQGLTIGWFNIDEAQEVPLELYTLLKERSSDKRMLRPHRLVLGLAEYGTWAEQVAKDADAATFTAVETDGVFRVVGSKGADKADAAYFTAIATDVNSSNLREGYADEIAENTTVAEYNKKRFGLKQLPKGRLFKGFEPKLYIRGAAEGEGGSLVRYDYDSEYETIIGIDFGRNAAVTFRQKRPDHGTSILFRELVPDDISTELIGLRILDIAVPRGKARPGDTRIRIDRVWADPAGASFQSASGLKDIRVLSEVLGMDVGYSHDQRIRNPKYRADLIDAHLLNAAGKRRLLVSTDLYEQGMKCGPHDRSVVQSLIRSKFAKDKKHDHLLLDELDKDGIDDHSRDALGYDVANEESAKIQRVGVR